ncbi:hypothetical protein M8J76_006371 [Diaphorina citri]|nr:hypothetical protein M8J76_006371 [Diaphorina citri]
MNSEELLLRAAEERHAIVERYLKGRHAGAEIHSWEEPDNDFYGNFDRFGFITDSKNEESSAQKDGLEKKDKEIELEREKKWAKMFHKWDKVPADKLKRRVYKGIPNSCRGRGWSLLLNLPDPGDGDESNPRSMDMRQRYEESTRKYEEMRDLAWKYSPDIRQIDLDVNRTYREHNMFRDRYSVKQTQLFNVLAAYSVYNLEIGYCQGMSQIAAVLLMYLSEEEAFWALSSLVSDSKYSMHGFFIPGFPKLLRYQEHHDKIMSKFLPKLKKHLDKNNVDTGIYTLKWFFQCFLDRIPFKLTLRVWDIYILEGERIMTAMAYNLLKMHQRQLAKLSMDDILHFIQVKLEKQFQYTDDATIESLQKCLEELKRNKLDYAGQPSPAELPKSPLGVFKPDAHAASFEQKIGRRSSEFSSVEKATQETVITRRDTAVALAALADRNSSIGTDASKYTPPSRRNSARERRDERDLASEYHDNRDLADEYHDIGRNSPNECYIDRNLAKEYHEIGRNSSNEYYIDRNSAGDYHDIGRNLARKYDDMDRHSAYEHHVIGNSVSDLHGTDGNLANYPIIGNTDSEYSDDSDLSDEEEFASRNSASEYRTDSSIVTDTSKCSTDGNSTRISSRDGNSTRELSSVGNSTREFSNGNSSRIFSDENSTKEFPNGNSTREFSRDGNSTEYSGESSMGAYPTTLLITHL